MPYVTRVLSSASTGEFNYSNTIASYFALVAMMGLAMFGSRKVSVNSNNQDELNKSFSSLYFIQLINGIVCLVAYVGFVLIFSGDNSNMAWINCIYVTSCLFDLTWFISGIERFRSLAIRNILINILSTVCIFIFVRKPTDLYIYALIKCSAVLISQLFLFVTVWKYVKLVKVSKASILLNYKNLLVLFIPVLAETVFHSMDRTMLGGMIGFAAVGIYYSSRMVTDIPQTVVTSINVVMFPRLSQLESIGEREKSKELFNTSFEFINLLCIALAFGIASIAKDFVPLYFGEDYQDCAQCIPLLTPYIALAAWNGTIRYQILLPRNKEKIYVVAIVVGIFANLILNIFLIRQFGVRGAIYATLISEIIILVIQTAYVWKEISFSFHALNFVFYCAFGVAMFFGVSVFSQYVTMNAILKLLVEIAIGAIIYLSLCFIFVLLNKKLKELIVKVLHKKEGQENDINNNASV